MDRIARPYRLRLGDSKHDPAITRGTVSSELSLVYRFYRFWRSKRDRLIGMTLGPHRHIKIRIFKIFARQPEMLPIASVHRVVLSFNNIWSRENSRIKWPYATVVPGAQGAYAPHWPTLTFAVVESVCRRPPFGERSVCASGCWYRGVIAVLAAR